MGKASKTTGCYVDGEKIERIDYKDINLLRKFITPSGKIKSRERNDISARCQRMVAQAVKRARHIALLPYEKKW